MQFYFSETLSGIIDVIEECTDYGVNLVKDMEELLYEEKLFCPGEQKAGIVQLETALLQAGGFPNMLHGLFYVLPLYQDGKLFVRYVGDYSVSLSTPFFLFLAIVKHEASVKVTRI